MISGFSPLSEIKTPQRQLGVSDRSDCWFQEQPFLTHFNLRGDPLRLDFLQTVQEHVGVELPLLPIPLALLADGVAAGWVRTSGYFWDLDIVRLPRFS